MKEPLIPILAALLIIILLLLGHNCARRERERDQTRWALCVTTCDGSALVESNRCLCIE